MGDLFGTDGVRGVANAELTPELTVGLGRALVRSLHEQGVDRPAVAVGRDPRISGQMLEAALTAGCCSAGGDVVPLGVLPTPGVALLTTRLDVDCGVMISASHNPVGDNGIKVFGPDGFKLDDAREARVEQLIDVTQDPPVGSGVGGVRPSPGAHGVYVDHLVGAAEGTDLSGLRVVVDCANGAAYEVAPTVLARLGCEVVAINDRPDGLNINDGCGSTEPGELAKRVVADGADVGLAHDGDADRLIAVDAEGRVVDGDQILAVLAEAERAGRGLEAVVTTVMTNLGFRLAMERMGIDVVETRVGDRYVLEAMRAGGHRLGGEPSGHVIMADHARTGDGVLTAVRLLRVMVERGRPLADLAGVMERLPQVLVNVRDVQRDRLDRAERVWREVARVEGELDGSGRVLVRASGTEPMVRVMVEADHEARAQGCADRIAEVVAAELG